MRLLAFDCAGAAVSVAVIADDAPIAAEQLAMRRGQGEVLLPMILRVLEQARLRLDALDALATTIGPGSYTGLRIGLSAAAGLSLGARLPVIGVTTLAAVAARAQADAPGPVVVALESQRAELFVQSFDANGRPLGEPQALLPEAAALAVPPGRPRLAGDGAARLLAALGASADSARLVAGAQTPDAVWVSRLALARVAADPGLLRAGGLPAPLYLRPPLATPLPFTQSGVA